MNTKDIESLVKICKMSQEQLLYGLGVSLKKKYKKVVQTKHYVYAKGKLPVLLVAHLDTVHKENVKEVFIDFDSMDKITSPQGIGGDDRCGVFIILKLLALGFRPSVLFCTDEEIGGIGADMFTKAYTKLKNVNFMIEFDRRGSEDVVRYEDENEELTKVLEEFGYKEAFGTFSDISILAPHFGVSAVNLSSGYYRAHTKEEYIVLSEVELQIERMKKFLSSEHVNKKHIYEEIYRNPYTYNYYYDNYYSSLWHSPIDNEMSIPSHATCAYCGTTHHINLLTSTPDGYLCEDCLEILSGEYVECEICGAVCYSEDANCHYCGHHLKEENAT